MTLEGPWMLHMPFSSAPELPFTDELAETVAGRTIFIGSDIAPSYKRLVVKEIDTVDQACSQFNALKRGMLTVSLNVPCGIRIQDELVVVDDDAMALPSEPAQPFVCRQGRSLARLVITVGEPQKQLSRVFPRMIQDLEVGITSSPAAEAMRDKLVMLAFDLYTDSFFERAIAARFITLIGVLEVLKDQDSVSPAAMRLIDEWRADLDKLGSAEADSLRSQLSFMKRVSIGRGIGRVVARHLGEGRAREVQKLYGIRSKLVHGGERPSDLEDKLRDVQLIVRELLISVLRSGSR